MKKYIPIKNEKANNLKVQVYYNKGGMNYFSNLAEKRGFYISVSPVERSEHKGIGGAIIVNESYSAFSGTKRLIKEVKRNSEKGLNEAIEISKELENELIEHVCSKNGIEIPNL